MDSRVPWMVARHLAVKRSAISSRRRHSVPISHHIDESDRILHIRFAGTVSGTRFRTFASELYGARPDLFDFACILDLLQFEGDVSYADLVPLQANYAKARDHSAPTRPGFIVTTDPNFHFWAAALDEQFPGRKHYLAPSMAEALSRLDKLRRQHRPRFMVQVASR